MEDPTDRIFVCQNEYCGEHSCRYCRVRSHHPKTCEGIIPIVGLELNVDYRNEQKREKMINAKHTVEEAMTAALLNICNSCGRRFLKDYGCNKMKCTCGNTQCHVCGQNAKYDHFGPTTCPLYDDTEARERREVAAAQLQTVRTLLKERKEMNPEELTVDKALIENANDLKVIGNDYDDDLYGQSPPPEDLARLKDQRIWEEEIERERERVAQIARELNERQEKEQIERRERARQEQEEAEERVRMERERQEMERQQQLELEKREREEKERRRTEQLERERLQRGWEEEQRREYWEMISAIDVVEEFKRTERQQSKRETLANEREKYQIIEEPIPAIPMTTGRKRAVKRKEVPEWGKQHTQKGFLIGSHTMERVRRTLRKFKEGFKRLLED